MLIPRYYFSNDFSQFYDYLLSKPHKKKFLKKGDFLWKAGEVITEICYILKGTAQAVVIHEEGYHKILSYHGSNTMYPGCQKTQFNIEESIVVKALTDMEILSFDIKDFYVFLEENPKLTLQFLELYSMFINLLIFETAHQEYNSTITKICNLLYIFSTNSPNKENQKIPLTQEEIGEILTINRVNISKNLSTLRNEKIIATHRNCIEIIDKEKLLEYCSKEAVGFEK